MKLKLVTVPNPILRQKSKPVKKIDKKTKKLSQAMIDLIKTGPDGQPIGVGLSAVQIGKPLQLFVAFNPQTKKYQVFLNPQITARSKELTDGVPEKENKAEGCLSVPNLVGIVKRHLWIKLRYQTLENEEKEEEASGLFATIIQHESDHLQGILFTDRLLEQKGKVYQLKKDGRQEKLVEAEIIV